MTRSINMYFTNWTTHWFICLLGGKLLWATFISLHYYQSNLFIYSSISHWALFSNCHIKNMSLCHPAKSIWCHTLENKIEKKNQYLIIKCIFLIYVVTITPGSCYLQKLDLDKVIWDLLMVAASCTVWEAPLFRPRVCWEKIQEKTY